LYIAHKDHYEPKTNITTGFERCENIDTSVFCLNLVLLVGEVLTKFNSPSFFVGWLGDTVVQGLYRIFCLREDML